MRDSWSVYFLKIAYAVATRATCDRLHVGCVLVDPASRTILATGYNGSARGSDHCDDVGHDMVNGSCERTAHAEQNAIAQAAGQGAKVRGAYAYVTAYPCWRCARLLLNAGISKIVYAKAYRIDPRVEAAASRIGTTIEHVNVEDPIEVENIFRRNCKSLALEILDKKHQIAALEARLRRIDPVYAASVDVDDGSEAEAG